MANLVIIPNKKEDIDNIEEDVLLGIDGYSVNMMTISFAELKQLVNKRSNFFVSLNKNFVNKELKELEEILIYLSNTNIKGIFYYDVAIINIVKRLHLNLNLVWSSEHMTTNYYTINYWYNQGVYGTFLSNEITKDEMMVISDNTKSHLFVQLFGYIPMYVSRRHAISNYLNYFSIDVKANYYYLKKDDKKYPIVDNNEGTIIYTDFILNGLREYLVLKDKIEHIIINGYNIDSKLLNKVISMFKIVTNNNIDELELEMSKMFDNLGSGFLYEESIYRVKNNDK